jgi:pimeloyl-ACP methyl ester carboxylesterase
MEALRSAHRRGHLLGLALCLGTPALIAGLVLSGAVPPGRELAEGVYRQVGYLLTGLVFLSAAWVWWRSGRVLGEFRDIPEGERPATVIRESLLYAATFEVSSLCGLVYWTLVGTHGGRHTWGFILLTPVLFLAFVPRYDRWVRQLEG